MKSFTLIIFILFSVESAPCAKFLRAITDYPAIVHWRPNSKLTRISFCTKKNPDFSHFFKGVPICKRNVSNITKRKIYALYSIPKRDRFIYTIDHISLALGFDNESIWPMHRFLEDPKEEIKIINAWKTGKINHSEAVIKMFVLKRILEK